MRIFSIIFLLTSCVAVCSAQKLPPRQTGSVKAPANVKTDGKAIECGDKFKAYNNSIEAYYTIANNDSLLFFTLKATKREIIDKILRGGITLMFKHTEQKKDADAVALTYPVLRGTDMLDMTNLLARRLYPPEGPDTVTLKGFNATLEAKCKVLEVSGIKSTAEKQLSVYNEEGIKVAAALDNANALIYELAVPLKYLNLPGDRKIPFSYRVKINEEPVAKPSSDNMFPAPVVTGELGTTDLKGMYTLAK